MIDVARPIALLNRRFIRFTRALALIWEFKILAVITPALAHLLRADREIKDIRGADDYLGAISRHYAA